MSKKRTERWSLQWENVEIKGGVHVLATAGRQGTVDGRQLRELDARREIPLLEKITRSELRMQSTISFIGLS